MFSFKKDTSIKMLGELLTYQDNRESLLGMKSMALPTPEQIKSQSAKLAHYSESQDYKVFVEEVWGRILNHLDIILDDRTSDEKVKYHRGALKETLDLLRLSYQARHVLEEMAKTESLPQ